MHALPRRTPSLLLRHFVADEAAALRTLSTEASTSRWLPSHVDPTIEDAVSRLAYLVSCYVDPGDPVKGPYVLAVEHRDTGRLLGHLGFSPVDDEVEVSYSIAEAARGRGYGVETLVHGCAWLAETFAVPQIIAITASANAASRRVLERAAFVLEHEGAMIFQGREEIVSRYRWRASEARGLDAGHDIVVRDATPADLPALCAVRDARAQHEGKLAEAGTGSSRFLVATIGGEIIAFASVFLLNPALGPAKSHIPKLSDCWVAAAFRSRGVGRALVSAGERIAREFGCERLYVGIDPVANPRWLEFFRRRGYEPLQPEPYRKLERWVTAAGVSEEVVAWRVELVIELGRRAEASGPD